MSNEKDGNSDLDSDEVGISKESQNISKNQSKVLLALSEIKRKISKLKWWTKTIAAMTVLGTLTSLLSAPILFDYFFQQNETACGRFHTHLDKRSGALTAKELRLLENKCGSDSVAVFQLSGTNQYVKPKEMAKALSDQIKSTQLSRLSGSRYLAQLHFQKAENEVFFNRASALQSLRTAIQIDPNSVDAQIVLATLSNSLGVNPDNFNEDVIVDLLQSTDNQSNIVKLNRLMSPFMHEDWDDIDPLSDRGKEFLSSISTLLERLGEIDGFMAYAQRYGYAEVISDKLGDDQFIEALLEESKNCANYRSRKENAVCLRTMFDTGEWRLDYPDGLKTLSEIYDFEISVVETSLLDAGLIIEHARLLLETAKTDTLLRFGALDLVRPWPQQEKLLRKALEIVRQGGDPFLEADILHHLGANVVGFHKQNQEEAYHLIRDAIDLLYENGATKEALSYAMHNSWREGKYGSPERSYEELKQALDTLNFTEAGKAEQQKRLAGIAFRLGKEKEYEVLMQAHNDFRDGQPKKERSVQDYIEDLSKLNREGYYKDFRDLFEELQREPFALSKLDEIKLATLVIRFSDNAYDQELTNAKDISSLNLNYYRQNVPMFYKKSKELWGTLSNEQKQSPEGQSAFYAFHQAWYYYSPTLGFSTGQQTVLARELFELALEEQRIILDIPKDAPTSEVISYLTQAIKDNTTYSEFYHVSGLAIFMGREFFASVLDERVAESILAPEPFSIELLSDEEQKVSKQYYPLLKASYNFDKSFAAPIREALQLQALALFFEDWRNSLEYAEQVEALYPRAIARNEAFWTTNFVSLTIKADTAASHCQDKTVNGGVKVGHCSGGILPSRAA